jgi:hypothetical protein
LSFLTLDLPGRALLVLELDAPVLQRVDGVLLVGRVARRVDAVLGRRRAVVARGRRVGLVLVVDRGVGGQVRAALARVRLERAARGLHGGVEVGDLLGRQRGVDVVGGGLAVAPAAAAGDDRRDHRRDGGEPQHAPGDQLQPALAGRLAGLGLFARLTLKAPTLLLFLTARHARERSGARMNLA